MESSQYSQLTVPLIVKLIDNENDQWQPYSTVAATVVLVLGHCFFINKSVKQEWRRTHHVRASLYFAVFVVSIDRRSKRFELLVSLLN